jgi:hypothetical protein
MQIHATNIRGLGASQVVVSFLDAYSRVSDYDATIIHLPQKGILSNYIPKSGLLKRFRRVLPNGISRFIECFFSFFYFSNIPTIVLGDIPLRGITNQIVLVHQPNLIYPKINSNSSKSFNFRISRFLFSINLKYVKKVIVQTGAMALDMEASYPKIKNKIVITPQPVPNWLEKNVLKYNTDFKQNIKLFYPAAYYPHKKHNFLIKLNNFCRDNNIDFGHIEVWLTLDEKEFNPCETIKWVKNLGRLNSKEMNIYYQKADALLFLSSIESYGLPLIEAISLNLPILTVDYPYSRWICENNGFYFKGYSEKSFLKTLNNLVNNLSTKKKIDYSQQISKFPDSWEDIVKEFLKSLFN